ncbi:uncharacterized protein BDR25DRAFT_302890 [Lindgomyces ingoldianus]|uniref:Uncharacterized protein n=1 Tax=Lindgomyces ingoldianus TaxID=673940 RepID=A0ACB6R1B1_9PLEO|nr:uncharacterized protein BDR25DRAFT_302890 [Lindgomyces ingoldianus]KAF2472115.1 hypothetical protein BDR25DRAFT_302890 [Lindgomyces ingoldianus]
MANQQDDLLNSLESSLRNALFTFGAESPQYHSIKFMVEEHISKTKLRTCQENPLLSQALGVGKGVVMNLAFRPKEK